MSPEIDLDRLDAIALYRLEVPLTKPYRLAFGDVLRYDTIIAVATDAEGRTGFGEATVLTGYTDETIADAWRTAREAAPRIAFEGAVARRATLAQLAETHPFTATAFGTALEMLEPAFDADAIDAAVPLVGLLDAKGEEAIAAQLNALLAAGYRTIKAKVGFEVEADARFVRDVQRANRGRARIRVDANQGYSAEQGVDFVRRIEPDAIELFEQPCAAGDWESHLEVARAASVPLMLDESIYGMADIEKAAKLRCAQFIKLKLMKLVTLDALAAGLTRIRELGMQPVLGNGVACDPGCWLEARAAARLIDNVGEMNGHLKIGAALLDPPLPLDKGAIRLVAGYRPRLNMETVERFCVDSMQCARAARAAGRAA